MYRTSVDEPELNIFLLLFVFECRHLTQVFVVHRSSNLAVQCLESLFLYSRDVTAAVSERGRETNALRTKESFTIFPLPEGGPQRL
jgi:hypothetical protein